LERKKNLGRIPDQLKHFFRYDLTDKVDEERGWTRPTLGRRKTTAEKQKSAEKQKK
jgi:hypothetical protein